LVCDDRKILKAHKVVLSASSSVFHNIVKDLPQNNSVIYLRGINHVEMEAILKYMYLGEATFSEDRMTEFLSVADNLDIKELGKNIEFDNREEYLKSEGEVDSTSADEIDDSQNDEDENFTSKDDPLMKNYAGAGLVKEEISESVSFENYQAEIEDSLRKHTQSQHEEVKFSCNQCEYKALRKGYLRSHIKSIHEGVKYDCNLCEYKATQPGNLRTHIQSKHEGVKFPCNLCNQPLNSKSSLIMHMKAKHQK